MNDEFKYFNVGDKVVIKTINSKLKGTVIREHRVENNYGTLIGEIYDVRLSNGTIVSRLKVFELEVFEKVL